MGKKLMLLLSAGCVKFLFLSGTVYSIYVYWNRRLDIQGPHLEPQPSRPQHFPAWSPFYFWSPVKVDHRTRSPVFRRGGGGGEPQGPAFFGQEPLSPWVVVFITATKFAADKSNAAKTLFLTAFLGFNKATKNLLQSPLSLYYGKD